MVFPRIMKAFQIDDFITLVQEHVGEEQRLIEIAARIFTKIENQPFHPLP